MSKPYVYERQTEYWTSRGIEDYFLDSGYEVITFPLTQRTEKSIPFDFIFCETRSSKIFGLQYKTLYRNERDFWVLDESQHKNLQPFSNWGYYCFSEMKSSSDHRVAIHKALFVPVKINYESKVFPGNLDALYYRWGGFINGIERCTVGKIVNSKEEFEKLFDNNINKNEYELNLLFDVFIANLAKRRLLHFDGRNQTP